MHPSSADARFGRSVVTFRRRAVLLISMIIPAACGGPAGACGPGRPDPNVRCPAGTVLVGNACTGRAQNHYRSTCDCQVGDSTVARKSLDVCLPAELNPNLADGRPAPTAQQLIDDSRLRVLPHYQAIAGLTLGLNYQCQCDSTTAVSRAIAWDPSCDAPCTDPSGVCVVAGADPPEPTPEPLSAALFTPSSICDVTGPARITLDGEDPLLTAASGVLYIHGRPCPLNQPCSVGLAYELGANPITISKLFGSATLNQLSVSGASEPSAVTLALAGVGGLVPAGALLSGARGRKDSDLHIVGVGRNPTPLQLTVNWPAKTCSLQGTFIPDTESPMELALSLDGTLRNQPPRASAGPDQTVECTSALSTPVSLSASGSTDPEGGSDIIAYGWRLGAPDAAHVVAPSSNPSLQTVQPVGQATYHLEVVDEGLAADRDSVSVSVVDTTAPGISCNAPPTIFPNDEPISFKATAGDSCSAVGAVTISNVECFEVKSNGRLVDKTSSCRIQLNGDTLTILNSGGVNTVIRWAANVKDAADNERSETCEVLVARPPDR